MANERSKTTAKEDGYCGGERQVAFFQPSGSHNGGDPGANNSSNLERSRKGDTTAFCTLPAKREDRSLGT